MKNAIKAITTLTIDAADLTGAFEAFAAGGLTQACVIIRVVNYSNVDVSLSYDGVLSHEFIPSGSYIQRQFQTNSQPNNKAAKLAKGTNVGVIGATGVGTIYFIGYYQE